MSYGKLEDPKLKYRFEASIIAISRFSLSVPGLTLKYRRMVLTIFDSMFDIFLIPIFRILFSVFSVSYCVIFIP